MVKFVDVPVGMEVISVNPERVAYIRKRGDFSSLVFEGFGGGKHELGVMLSRQRVAELLEQPGAPLLELAEAFRGRMAAELGAGDTVDAAGEDAGGATGQYEYAATAALGEKIVREATAEAARQGIDGGRAAEDVGASEEAAKAEPARAAPPGPARPPRQPAARMG